MEEVPSIRFGRWRKYRRFGSEDGGSTVGSVGRRDCVGATTGGRIDTHLVSAETPKAVDAVDGTNPRDVSALSVGGTPV
jgi:hypothetical protein